MDLQRQLAAGDGAGGRPRGAFIEVAAGYGERKGITYQAGRSLGVERRVLRAAGIGRGS